MTTFLTLYKKRIIALPLIIIWSILSFGQIEDKTASTSDKILYLEKFNKIDQYFDESKYDSAQLILNFIHENIPLKDVSLTKYFLLTRQAEVYYYNNLHQYGLSEVKRALAIAQALQDSTILLDCYNFLGLFYINIDSLDTSITYFNEGMKYISKQPTPSTYISLSKAYHLYGNIAEAYYKLKQYEDAKINYKLSLNKATEIQQQRGMAIANAGLGDVAYQSKQYKESLQYYEISRTQALSSKNYDVALLCYGGGAKCKLANGEYNSMQEQLNQGYDLMKKHVDINKYFTLLFLDAAIFINKKTQKSDPLVSAFDKIISNERTNGRDVNKHIEKIINSGITYENKLLQLEIEDAKYKKNIAYISLIIALGIIGLMFCGLLLYRYYINQKIEGAKIRQTISQDLHDDIGASLSSLQIYSTIAEQSLTNDLKKANEMIQKIKIQSKGILENMSDIVWSMKTNDSSGTLLQAKIKNYSTEILEGSNIVFDCKINNEAEVALENMKARKNVLLIIREIINNASKYSNATKINLKIYVHDKSWIIEISDDGRGFETNIQQKGNGLKNIKSRVMELKGNFTLDSQNGTRYVIVFPMAVITNTGW